MVIKKKWTKLKKCKLKVNAAIICKEENFNYQVNIILYSFSLERYEIDIFLKDVEIDGKKTKVLHADLVSR